VTVTQAMDGISQC